MKRRLTDKPEAKVSPDIRLYELAGAVVDLDCPLCGWHAEMTGTEMTKRAGGGARFRDVLERMRCGRCYRKGAPEIRIRSGPGASPFDRGDEVG